MLDIKDIKLTKGMKKEEVNELISEYLTFEDDVYLGCNYKHKWRCKCGESFERLWNDIRRKKSIKCFNCIYNLNKKCKICGEKVYCKELCSKHYAQLKKYGDFLDDSSLSRKSPQEIIIHEDYAEVIVLNKRYEEKARIKIDLEDIEKIRKYKWNIDGNGYGSYSNGKDNICMHRYILNCNDILKEVDHINHNILDNRKSNLRIVDKFQNSMNRDLGTNNKSGYRGINWQKESNKWMVRITVEGKVIYLGLYEDLEEAINVRIKAEEKYFGKYNNENVIKTSERNNKYNNNNKRKK